MSQATLTIIVPTYNRAAHLTRLLSALRSELQGLESLVEVLVSDNASTDSTPEVTTAAARDWPVLKIQRHDRNLGPDGNFLSCVPRVSTRYFWIIGDDDCPKRGVLAKVVRLLKERVPALVYMQSEWVNPVLGPDQGETVEELVFSELDVITFAKELHIWFTFISGMVVDLERLKTVLKSCPLERFNGTSLVQLGWVLPLLKTEGPFIYIKNRCVLATTDNSGGYAFLTVFCVNFPRIVNDVFGRSSQISRSIINGAVMRFLPGRIWEARQHKSGTYTKEDPWREIRREHGKSLAYWTFLAPIGKFPTWIAFLVYTSWRITNRFRIVHDSLKSKIKTQRALAAKRA